MPKGPAKDEIHLGRFPDAHITAITVGHGDARRRLVGDINRNVATRLKTRRPDDAIE